MNVIAYITYLLLTGFITLYVGQVFYRNGRHYILRIFQGQEGLTDLVNKILLTGYYLLNLGYAAIMLIGWESISTVAELVGSVSKMTGQIVTTLAVIHYFNMYIIKKLGQKTLASHH